VTQGQPGPFLSHSPHTPPRPSPPLYRLLPTPSGPLTIVRRRCPETPPPCQASDGRQELFDRRIASNLERGITVSPNRPDHHAENDGQDEQHQRERRRPRGVFEKIALTSKFDKEAWYWPACARVATQRFGLNQRDIVPVLERTQSRTAIRRQMPTSDRLPGGPPIRQCLGIRRCSARHVTHR